ncbi:hypothetical protein DY000_02016137 [Brassica cretica]|uniref:Uncharacterized protein n=1 Tax=Brassica cretica TaxID=69181 RepID=A0ABQ7CYN8_BRACR|nr:hypothetical protein DY000_02016137 [Brassica cretica]
MDFGRTSIDEATAISVDMSKAISSDKSTAISVDDAHQTSIDSTPPEACKYSLTDDANVRVVLGKPKGQLSNANNQIMHEKGTEIPVQIKSISERDNEWKLPFQDYLNPGRTYSNRSAIRLPKDDTKKFGISPEYLIMRLIKNIATGRSYEMMDVELGRKADPVEESPLLEIEEHLDSPHPALEGQNQFEIYQIDDDTLSELEQQIYFVDRQTLKNNYPNPDSLTQNYEAIVASRQDRAKSRLNQAFMGNRKLATDLNRKIDLIFSELTRKFDTLSEHIKRLDSQVTENGTAIKRETGHLPGGTDANPKRQVNAVLLRSGKCLIPRAIEINNTEKHVVVEETSESRSRPIILDDPSTESEVTRGRERPNTEEEAIDFEEEEGENGRGCRNRSTRKNKRRSTNHGEYPSTLWKQCRSTPDSC